METQYQTRFLPNDLASSLELIKILDELNHQKWDQNWVSDDAEFFDHEDMSEEHGISRKTNLLL